MAAERDAAERLFGLLGDNLDFQVPTGGKKPRKGEVEAESSPEDGDAEDLYEEGAAEEESEEEFEDEEEYEESEDEDADADEDEGDEEEDDDPRVPQTFKVKVAGQEYDITLDEALAGYQRQQDYTRKTQEIAQERRALDDERSTARAEREAYAQRLQVLTQALESQVPKEPDWDKLKAENPAKFAAEYADWQRKQEQVRALQKEAQRLQQQRAAEWEQQRTRLLEEAAQKLHEAVPEWRTAKAEQVQAEKIRLAEYAMSTYGFTPQELEAVIDHRPILLLRKAMLYDQMTEKGTKVVQKAKPKSQVLPPGTPKGPPSVKKRTQAARKRLSSSGRPEDAASVLFDLIEDF